MLYWQGDFVVDSKMSLLYYLPAGYEKHMFITCMYTGVRRGDYFIVYSPIAGRGLRAFTFYSISRIGQRCNIETSNIFLIFNALFFYSHVFGFGFLKKYYYKVMKLLIFTQYTTQKHDTELCTVHSLFFGSLLQYCTCKNFADRISTKTLDVALQRKSFTLDFNLCIRISVVIAYGQQNFLLWVYLDFVFFRSCDSKDHRRPFIQESESKNQEK